MRKTLEVKRRVNMDIELNQKNIKGTYYKYKILIYPVAFKQLLLWCRPTWQEGCLR